MSEDALEKVALLDADVAGLEETELGALGGRSHVRVGVVVHGQEVQCGDPLFGRSDGRDVEMFELPPPEQPEVGGEHVEEELLPQHLGPAVERLLLEGEGKESIQILGEGGRVQLEVDAADIVVVVVIEVVQDLDALAERLDGGRRGRLAPGDDLAVPEEGEQVLVPGLEGALLQRRGLEVQRAKVAHVGGVVVDAVVVVVNGQSSAC